MDIFCLSINNNIITTDRIFILPKFTDMKKLIFSSIFLIGLVSLFGQISITADSVILCKSDEGQDKFVPVNNKAERFSLEIDKDLLTLRVFGTDHEHAVIEKAYILNLLDVDPNKEKWMFQAVDKNCMSYTITLDVPRKRIGFINFVNEPTGDKHIAMFYYPISDIQINKEAIDAHLKEKANNK